MEIDKLKGDSFMGREIKFRAWDKDSNKMLPWAMMVTGFLQGFLNKKYNVELMQFIGLHDKNGKEIYEGDIVCLDNHDILKAEIIYEFNGFYFKWINIRCANVRGRLTEPIFNNIYLWEIIGNIYENPELLEQSNG